MDSDYKFPESILQEILEAVTAIKEAVTAIKEAVVEDVGEG